MKGFEIVELYKNGKLVFKGIRSEVAHYLGISRSNLSTVMTHKLKKYEEYSFKVIPLQYDVLEEGKVIFTGSRYEIMDKFEVQESQFAKVLMGVTRLNGLYRIERSKND